MRFVAGEYFPGKQQMFLQTGTSDVAAQNPARYPERFHFHSDFTYFRLVGESSGSVTFRGFDKQTRTVSYEGKKGKGGGSDTFDVPAVYPQTISKSLGFTLPASATASVYNPSNNQPIPGFFLAQSSGSSFRLVTMSVAGGQIVFRSQAHTFASGIGSLTLNYKVYIFGLSITEGSDPGVLLRIEPGRVTFGQGKFDTNVPYLTQVSANASGAVFGNGPTIALSQSFDGVGVSYGLANIASSFGPAPATPSPSAFRAAPI